MSPHTILYYERRGLLPTARRSSKGYRLFSNDSLRQIRFIKRAQALGFSLREVKALRALGEQERATCPDIQEIVQAKVAEIDAKMRALHEARTQLTHLAEQCSANIPVCHCPVLQQLAECGD